MKKFFGLLLCASSILAMESNITVDESDNIGQAYHYQKHIRINGTARGYAVYRIFKYKYCDTLDAEAFIDTMYIEQDYRNHGYGKLLLIEVLKDISAKAGCTLKVWAHVGASNEGANQVFNALRFEKCDWYGGRYNTYNRSVQCTPGMIENHFDKVKEAVQKCQRAKY